MASRIYVVDDVQPVLRIIKLALELEGFEVECFLSSRVALANLDNPTIPYPDALVLDLSMPEMAGREFYRRTREMGVTCPVLILSAYGAEAAKRQLGAEAALSKPFDPEELAPVLRGILSEADAAVTQDGCGSSQ